MHKVLGERKFKVVNSFGVYGVYLHMSRNKWYNIGRPVKKHEYYAIIRGVNNLLAQEIMQGNPVTFPSKMGKLELRKFEKGARMVRGRVSNTYPINWGATNKLWKEDEEERRKKTVIRYEVPFIYQVRYNVYNATYKNKGFYKFALNSKIKKALKENINKGIVDTLW